MIKASAAELRWNAGVREWGIDVPGMSVVVTCDGCGTTQNATGIEWNGPRVDGVYGLNGWRLGEEDLCRACAWALPTSAGWWWSVGSNGMPAPVFVGVQHPITLHVNGRPLKDVQWLQHEGSACPCIPPGGDA